MRVIWRFFVGENMRWKWQQLGYDRRVIAESRSSYDNFERCIAAARTKGYVYCSAQEHLARPGLRIYARR